MSRPENKRLLIEPPLYLEFKAMGMPTHQLIKISMTLDEYEAIKLADYNGFSHSEAAEEMGISRPTFSRLIEKARKKLSEFLIKGRYLNIDGGNIHFKNNILHCRKCGHMFRIEMNRTINKCPHCESTDLLNYAGGHGHGKCCTRP